MITAITGKIRVGKTSFMTAKAVLNALDPEKRSKMLLEVSKLRARGYTVTENKFALYANYGITHDTHRGTVFSAVRIDPLKLAIRSRAAKAQQDITYIRPHCTIAIAEAQTYFNARTFQKFTPEQARFFQTSGHFGVDMYLDTQDFETLDKTIRGLCDIYHINERRIFDDKGRQVNRAEPRNVSRIIWYYDYYQNENGAPKPGSFEIDFNVYEDYNSFECYEDYLPENKLGTIL